MIKSISKRAVILALLAGISTHASNTSDTVIPTKHHPHLTLGQIAEITPGMGTIMMEYSHRFYIAYYAAKAGNW